MTPPLPDGLRPTPTGRLVRRVLRLLNTPPARVLLTLLALLVLLMLFGG